MPYKNKTILQNYQKKYRKAHKQYFSKYNKLYQAEYSRRTNKEIREKFLLMYGGKCACCAESVQEFLAIDHINGQSGAFRRETGRQAYQKAIKEFRPDLYRILCHNCNMATRWGKTCPHILYKK